LTASVLSLSSLKWHDLFQMLFAKQSFSEKKNVVSARRGLPFTGLTCLDETVLEDHPWVFDKKRRLLPSFIYLFFSFTCRKRHSITWNGPNDT
jgi:hypothetical protein